MTSTHNYIMFFTNKGRVYRLKGYEIPESSRTARGVNIINLLQLQPEEKITAIIPLSEDGKQHYLVMATRNGIVKKTGFDEYKNVRKNGLAAISLREGDELIEVKQNRMRTKTFSSYQEKVSVSALSFRMYEKPDEFYGCYRNESWRYR